MRKNTSIYSLFVLLLIIQGFNFSSQIYRANIDSELQIQATSDTFLINDFNNFDLYTDNDYVESFKENDYIQFNYTGSNDSSTSRREQYVLLLDDFGNCSDFSIATTFIYHMNDISEKLTFKMLLGSYYYENGSYVGLKPFNNWKQNSRMVGGGIWDAWGDNTGRFSAIAYPYDIKESEVTNYNSLELNGEIEVSFERVNSTITTTIMNENYKILELDNIWNEGLDRPVNYIVLDFYSSGLESNVSLLVNEISGVLDKENKDNGNPENITISFPIMIFPLTILSFLLLLIPIRLYNKRKSKGFYEK